MKTSIVIYRPLGAVWEYFSTAENWQAWWGGALESIVPDWEEGAILRWSMGEPTRLVHFIPRRQAGLQGKWMETIFCFEDAPGGSTRLEVEIVPRSGASFPDGGKAHIEDISAAIDRLKRLLEGTPLPEPAPGVAQAQIAANPAEEAPLLRGRSYLALIFSMFGIGLVFSLIPCLVVNTLASGALAAWLWVVREKMTDRWYLRRGLLAGMLAGLGASLVGTVFFLSNDTQVDFAGLMLAIAGVLALFLLPAALGGLLAAFVLRSRARRQAAVTPDTSPPPVALPPDTAQTPALGRAEIESRMHASASQGLSSLPATTPAETTRRVVRRVTTGAEFAFAVDRVMENLPASLADHQPRSTVQLFPHTLVAVTVFPAWRPEDVRDLLPNGYVALVQDLAAPFEELDEQPHLAHWAFTSDGNLTSVYLTVIPNPDSDRDAPALIARELLTQQERIDLGV